MGGLFLTRFSFPFQWVEAGYKLASTFTQGKKSFWCFSKSLAGLESDARASHLLIHIQVLLWLLGGVVWVRRATGSSTTVHFLMKISNFFLLSCAPQYLTPYRECTLLPCVYWLIPILSPQSYIYNSKCYVKSLLWPLPNNAMWEKKEYGGKYTAIHSHWIPGDTPTLTWHLLLMILGNFNSHN